MSGVLSAGSGVFGSGLLAGSGVFTTGLSVSGILTATSGVFNSGITAGTGLFTAKLNVGNALTATTGLFPSLLTASTGISSGLVTVAGHTILSNVNVLGATYDSVSKSITAQETTPTDLFFSPDGLKMYVVGLSNSVKEYNLSTPWVVSSAAYSTSFSVNSEEGFVHGLFFRADGLKMYIIGTASQTVFQYALTTPWSVASASYESINFSIASQEAVTTSVFFKPNGLSMYVVGTASDNVHQYTLSTAWNVSSATYLQSFSILSQEGNSRGLFFVGDGSRMFVNGIASVGVNVYNLSTPWNISTAAFVGVFTSSQDVLMQGIYIKPDGTKMYLIGNTLPDTVYQYTVPSIDIQLTGPTSIAALDVQQDLNVYGKTTVGSLTATSGLFTAGLNTSGILTATSGVFNSGLTASSGSFLLEGIGIKIIPAPSNGIHRIKFDTSNAIGDIFADEDAEYLGFSGGPWKFTGAECNLNSATINTIASFDGSKNVVSLDTSTYPTLTELSYVKGVTSSVQTQLNGKQNTLTNPVTGTGIASHVAYWNSSSGIVADSGQLYWDNTNNRLGIGTSSPQDLIHISGSTANGVGIRFENNDGYAGSIQGDNGTLYFNSSTATAFRISGRKIRLGDGSASTSALELSSVGSISQDGNGGGLTFSGTTGRFSNGLEITGGITATTGLFNSVTLSSGQIVFPSTANLSSGANTLDDYEEGTWTATFTASSPPSVSYDSAVRYGIYIKIGKTVFISGTVALTAASGGSGNLQISGLPFNAASGTTGGYGSLAVGYRTGWTTTTPGTAYVQAGGNYIQLLNEAMTIQITTANLSATSYIMFSGFYITTV